ncbi:MAG: glycosyltransferase family 4 protein [Candidatus Omnitrophota bacterium]
MKVKAKVLFPAALPPPQHGVCLVNKNILEFWDDKKSELIFVDISDKRISIENIGRLDFINLFLAFKHLFLFLYYLLRYNPQAVILNLSQGFWGFFRDSSFIISARFLSRARIACRFPGGDFLKFYNSSNKPLKKFIIKTLGWVNLIITEGKNIGLQFEQISPGIKTASITTGIADEGLYSEHKAGEGFNILFIANHRKEKGFFDALYILPDIKKENSQIKFSFVGELSFSKKELDDINNFIRQNQLEGMAEFPGLQHGQEKGAYFRASDLLILPSYTEGLPLSILEGLSAGLVIIATNVGVIPEVIKEGENGFLFTPGDREALKKHILFLADHRDLTRQISRRNRLYFESQFRVERFVKELQDSIELLSVN